MITINVGPPRSVIKHELSSDALCYNDHTNTSSGGWSLLYKHSLLCASYSLTARPCRYPISSSYFKVPPLFIGTWMFRNSVSWRPVCTSPSELTGLQPPGPASAAGHSHGEHTRKSGRHPRWGHAPLVQQVHAGVSIRPDHTFWAQVHAGTAGDEWGCQQLCGPSVRHFRHG